MQRRRLTNQRPWHQTTRIRPIAIMTIVIASEDS